VTVRSCPTRFELEILGILRFFGAIEIAEIVDGLMSSALPELEDPFIATEI
jgi:hypothetical protein